MPAPKRQRRKPPLGPPEVHTGLFGSHGPISPTPEGYVATRHFLNRWTDDIDWDVAVSKSSSDEALDDFLPLTVLEGFGDAQLDAMLTDPVSRWCYHLQCQVSEIEARAVNAAEVLRREQSTLEAKAEEFMPATPARKSSKHAKMESAIRSLERRRLIQEGTAADANSLKQVIYLISGLTAELGIESEKGLGLLKAVEELGRRMSRIAIRNLEGLAAVARASKDGRLKTQVSRKQKELKRNRRKSKNLEKKVTEKMCSKGCNFEQATNEVASEVKKSQVTIKRHVAPASARKSTKTDG